MTTTNTYEITEINPTLDNTGQIIRLAFKLKGTDSFANTESVIFDIPLHVVQIAQEYTDEELHEMCVGLCEAEGCYAHIDMKLINKRTPLYQAPSGPSNTLTDAEKKAIWVTQIDNTIASVYNQFTRFQMEYELRENAALAYRAGGYTGEPTVWIKSFADNTSITYKQCTDLVLSQAAKLRGAVALLGQLRMDKYKVLTAPTLEDAQIAFDSIIKHATQIAGSL